jgi:photosynthetic reaction center cytochrome c subunit
MVWRGISLGAAGVIMACLFGVTSGSGQTTSAMPGVQMAEQAFKNITVLRGISVDEFMDTMGFFSASLGWNCTDCHGDDAVEDWANFAKDTERKTMARKMILMVKFINQTQFGSMRRVTCYTCHRGDAQPKITPSLADQYGTPPPEDPDELEIPDRPTSPGTPSADQILDKYIQAVGGGQHLAALNSLVAKGTYSGYDTDNQKVPVDIYAKAPMQMTIIVHGNLGDSVRVFDGRAGWIASPDRPVPLLPLTGGDVTGAKIDATLVFSTSLKQLFPQWRVAQASIDDKDVWMVEGVAPGQLPLKLFFDESTGLLVRAVRLTDTVIGFNPTQLDFSDYRDVAGVKIPFHRVTTWTDNQTTIDLERVQPNAMIDEAKFTQPAPAPPPKIRQ